MQRESKFRAWDKIDHRYIIHEQDFIPLKVTNIGVFRLDATSFCDKWILLDAERFVIEEFTSLRDRHGKEIYEGDIVKSKYDIGKIVFNYGMYYVHLNKPLQGIFPETQNVNFDWNAIEIIGNIYENPELLEAKE